MRTIPGWLVLSMFGGVVGCSASAPGPATTPESKVQGPSASEVEAKLRTVLAGAQRTEEERGRDRFRHPLETLQFFGVRDSMRIVELAPGRGWYTAVLAPLLKEKGKLTVTSADPNGPPDAYLTKSAKLLRERFAKDPQSFGRVETVIVDLGATPTLGPDGSADMVVTFRNLHNWIPAGVATSVLQAAFRVLKRGGVLGVVEHRARPSASAGMSAIEQTGYVPEAYVVSLVEGAGFRLEGKSEINANPKDTADHPKGVWSLPPTFAEGESTREKYLAVGESDRMTLKFVKP